MEGLLLSLAAWCIGSTDITTAGTASLVSKPIPQEKYVVLVRHGLTTWNESKQIQVQYSLAH